MCPSFHFNEEYCLSLFNHHPSNNMSFAPEAEEKKRLLPVLWQLLLDKMEAEWTEKYSDLGDDPYSLEDLSPLAERIRAQLNLLSPTTTLSATEITAFFRADALPLHLSPEHLGALLRYLGFRDWEDFRHQCDEDDTTPPPRAGTGRKDNGDWFYVGP